MNLCFDMGTKESSVCISSSQGECLEEISLGTQKQSEKLIDTVDQLLRNQKVHLSQIENFIWGEGPGSFTGLRVGLSTLKAFALSVSKPIVSLNNHEVRAREWILQHQLLEAKLCVRTQGSSLWLRQSLYQYQNQTLQTITEEALLVNGLSNPEGYSLLDDHFPLRAQYLGRHQKACLYRKESLSSLDIAGLSPQYGIPTTFGGA